jgi:hypothetical protein
MLSQSLIYDSVLLNKSILSYNYIHHHLKNRIDA